MQCLWLRVVVLSGCVAAAPVTAGVAAPGCAGIWSAQGDVLAATNARGELDRARSVAPDGRHYVAETNGVLSFGAVGTSGSPLNVYVNLPYMEVVWSPDSKRFGINSSDGGYVGSWNFNVYSVEDGGRAVESDVYGHVRKLAGGLPRCDEPEVPNFGVVGWSKDGAEVLVVAQVPPHSSCKNMGETRGFRVSAVSGKMIEEIPAKALGRQWRTQLGCRVARSK